MENQTTFKLNFLWARIIDVYVEVAKVLEANKLKHWVAYGTLLGAVRHHGFIPWDDDFDICVPSDQYEDIEKVLSAQLPPYLKVVSPRNTPEFHENFMKIQDCREDVLLETEKQCGFRLPHGIYIDIFIVNAVPCTAISCLTQWLKVFFLQCHYIAHLQYGYPRSIKFYIYKIIAVLIKYWFRDVNNIQMVQLCKIRWGKVPQFGTTDKCGRFCGWVNQMYEWQCESQVFDKTLFVQFENIRVPIPEGFDCYLKANYGDYMKLPPVEERQIPYHSVLPDAPWRLGPTKDGTKNFREVKC